MNLYWKITDERIDDTFYRVDPEDNTWRQLLDIVEIHMDRQFRDALEPGMKVGAELVNLTDEQINELDYDD